MLELLDRLDAEMARCAALVESPLSATELVDVLEEMCFLERVASLLRRRQVEGRGLMVDRPAASGQGPPARPAGVVSAGVVSAGVVSAGWRADASMPGADAGPDPRPGGRSQSIQAGEG